MFWVYILENASGRLYVGHTDNLEARLFRHNRTDNRSTYTRQHGPWTLVWSEAHETRASAMSREKQIKSMKSAAWIRRELLNGSVPTGWD
jgi:putative endonuclease